MRHRFTFCKDADYEMYVIPRRETVAMLAQEIRASSSGRPPTLNSLLIFTSDPRPTNATAKHHCSMVFNGDSQPSGMTPLVRNAIIARKPTTNMGIALTFDVVALAVKRLALLFTQIPMIATSGASSTTRESLTTVAEATAADE